MALRKLRIMISSRCNTIYPFGDPAGETLSSIRKKLKREIEAELYFGKPLVNVWINETESEDGSLSSWEACLKQAAECDLFIAILDGEAGWQKDKSGIGICHAEFETAHSTSPGKVRVVSLLDEASGKVKTKPGPDLLFVEAVKRADLLELRDIKGANDLNSRVKELVRELVLQLAHEGSREVKQSGSNTGQALDWSRLNFAERQAVMTETIVESLGSKNRARIDGTAVNVPISGKNIMFKVTAIPAAFSVSAAREMVGQPFLRDHEMADQLGATVGGPVHIIACHKGVTEGQAMGLLGFPDATIISGSFGVYVADNIQKIQLCLISNCRDTSATKHGVQRLFEWLGKTSEDVLMANRAVSRAKILRTISQELAKADRSR